MTGTIRTEIGHWETLAERSGTDLVSMLPLHALVRDHGEAFTSVPWSTWRGSGYRRGKVRECYKNASHLAEWRPELRYVEGLAYCGIWGMHHAWCVTEDGRVVDPTWREKGHDLPVEAWEYLGVVIPDRLRVAAAVATGVYGVLSWPPAHEALRELAVVL